MEKWGEICIYGTWGRIASTACVRTQVEIFSFLFIDLFENFYMEVSLKRLKLNIKCGVLFGKNFELICSDVKKLYLKFKRKLNRCYVND